MKNWNTNTTQFRSKLDKKIWELSQLINYGFDGKKLSKKILTRYWSKLTPHLRPERSQMLEWLLWNKKSSPLSNPKFWNKSGLIKA